jgi:hypothetical protein
MKLLETERRYVEVRNLKGPTQSCCELLALLGRPAGNNCNGWNSVIAFIKNGCVPLVPLMLVQIINVIDDNENIANTGIEKLSSVRD